MITIIAGGRDYILTEKDYRFLDTLGITEVVSGKAPGADSCGEWWGRRKSIPVKGFPAKWNDIEAPGAVIKYRNGIPYNAKAGFDRNAQMADYGEAAVLFPGGKGTNDMFKSATDKGLIIHDRRETVST